MGFRDIISQMYPPKPKFTGDNPPNLHGKVYIVTGSNIGMGKELAQILYSKDAKVYLACRSKEKAERAISDIEKAIANSTGELIFLPLDLADLSTIKASVEEFLSKETKLHVLFNNAGFWCPPQGSKLVQGHELQLGVNNIAPFLFTKFVIPILAATAKSEPSGTVRVVWVSSSGAEVGSHKPGGIDLNNLDYHDDKPAITKYCLSKAGNYLHAVEYAKQHKADDIVSVALNPGNLDSGLYRDYPILQFILRLTILHPQIYGAYTELFAGLSPEVTLQKTGAWVVPWGRFMAIREDLVAASKTESEGGSGIAEKFWQWNEEQIKEFV